MNRKCWPPLENNFVVSYINLDPRQIPFHDFKEVYRALMGTMVFPNGETNIAKAWKESAAQWLARAENRDKAIGDFIPADMPHRFRAILAAMAHKNMEIPANKRELKKHARFQPRSFAWTLKNALMGKEIPALLPWTDIPLVPGTPGSGPCKTALPGNGRPR